MDVVMAVTVIVVSEGVVKEAVGTQAGKWGALFTLTVSVQRCVWCDDVFYRQKDH